MTPEDALIVLLACGADPKNPQVLALLEEQGDLSMSNESVEIVLSEDLLK